MAFDKMARLLDFRSHSKSGPFVTQSLFDHSKSRLVRILDPHCIQDELFSFQKVEMKR